MISHICRVFTGALRPQRNPQRMKKRQDAKSAKRRQDLGFDSEIFSSESALYIFWVESMRIPARRIARFVALRQLVPYRKSGEG